MKRPLTAKGEGRTSFRPAQFMPVAFQAWDGGAGETGPKMSLTSWYYLRLEEPQSSRHFIIPPVVALLTLAAMILVVRAANGDAMTSRLIDGPTTIDNARAGGNRAMRRR